MPGDDDPVAGGGRRLAGRWGWARVVLAAGLLVAGGTALGRAADETEYGWLGVSIREIGEEFADQLAVRFGSTEGNGVVVAEVIKGGPAERDGLRAGDVIVEVAGRPVWEIRQLQKIVRTLAIGRPIRVVVLRDAGRAAVPVTVGPMPEEAAAQLAGEAFGLLVRDLAFDRRPGREGRLAPEGRPSGGEAGHGIQVILVEEPSSASRAGMRVGDLILEIGGRAVSTLAEYRRTLRDAPRDLDLSVLVQRGEQRLALSLPRPGPPAPVAR